MYCSHNVPALCSHSKNVSPFSSGKSRMPSYSSPPATPHGSTISPQSGHDSEGGDSGNPSSPDDFLSVSQTLVPRLPYCAFVIAMMQYMMQYMIALPPFSLPFLSFSSSSLSSSLSIPLSLSLPPSLSLPLPPFFHSSPPIHFRMSAVRQVHQVFRLPWTIL